MFDRETRPRRPKRLGAALLPLAALLVATAFQATAQADPIVLTGGEVVIDRPNREARVNLVGLNFSVSFSIDTQFGGNFPAGTFRTSTFACGCDGFGIATFEGLGTQFFTGGGTYDNSTISGSISFYSAGFPGTQPVFTLNYVGTGFLTADGVVTRFTITGGAAPVPEPATLLLLGTGLAGLAARVRKRRGQRRAGGESPPP